MEVAFFVRNGSEAKSRCGDVSGAESTALFRQSSVEQIRLDFRADESAKVGDVQGEVERKTIAEGRSQVEKARTTEIRKARAAKFGISLILSAATRMPPTPTSAFGRDRDVCTVQLSRTKNDCSPCTLCPRLHDYRLEILHSRIPESTHPRHGAHRDAPRQPHQVQAFRIRPAHTFDCLTPSVTSCTEIGVRITLVTSRATAKPSFKTTRTGNDPHLDLPPSGHRSNLSCEHRPRTNSLPDRTSSYQQRLPVSAGSASHPPPLPWLNASS